MVQKIFFLQDSFICKFSSASLKHYLKSYSLFITVMSELLAEGCVSFYYSHSPPLLQGSLLSYSGKKRGLLEALESERFPLETKH